MTNQEVLAMQKGLNAKGYQGKDGKKLAEDGLLGAEDRVGLAQLSAGPGGKSYRYRQRLHFLYAEQNRCGCSDHISAAARQRQYQEADPASPALDAQHQANGPNLKKLEEAMKADPRAKEAFSSPEKTLNAQKVMNLLGFTGPDGKKLPENGVLDLNTLVAYDKLIHNGSFFGTAGSPISQALGGKSSGQTTNWTNQKIAADTRQIAAKQAQAAKEKATKEKARNKLNQILDSQYDWAKTVDSPSTSKQFGPYADPAAIYAHAQNYIGNIADQRMDNVFTEIDRYQQVILATAREMGLPPEVIASIYSRSSIRKNCLTGLPMSPRLWARPFRPWRVDF